MRYRVRKPISVPVAAATGAPANESETSADSQLSLSQRISPNSDSAVDAKAGGATTCLPYSTPSGDNPCSAQTDELCVTSAADSPLGFHRDAPILHGAAPHLSAPPREDVRL